MFTLVKIAYEWHVVPSALGICPPHEDLALMGAYIEVTSEMAAFEQQEAEREAKKKSRKL